MNRRPKLPSELEKCVLSAVIRGHYSLGLLTPSELSDPGKHLFKCLTYLQHINAEAPYTAEDILVTCDSLGIERAVVKPYLTLILSCPSSSNVAALTNALHDRQVLLSIINEAGAQLGDGRLVASKFDSLLQQQQSCQQTPLPLSHLLQEGIPPAPSGIALPTLPLVSEQTGGLSGVWVIGGPPGIGKSTLSWQIGITVGRQHPVIYYDFENGVNVLLHRTAEVFPDGDKLRSLTNHIYAFNSIRNFDTDVGRIEPPGLVVVDSIQKLPSSVEHTRSSLDQWIHRLEMLKHKSWAVLLVSEVSRAAYEADPFMGAFKETGEIEYAADVGIQLVEGLGSTIELHIVKNRHRPYKGKVCSLERVRSWWFKEK